MIQSGLSHTHHVTILCFTWYKPENRFHTPILLFQISFLWMSVNYSCYRVTETLKIYHEWLIYSWGARKCVDHSRYRVTLYKWSKAYYCFFGQYFNHRSCAFLTRHWGYHLLLFKKKVFFLSDDLNHWRKFAIESSSLKND